MKPIPALLLFALASLPSAARTAANDPPAGCVAPLTLRLRAGQHLPDLSGLPAPSPLTPPGPVVIQVPLYPGAVPTTQTVSAGPIFASASPYLKAAEAAYALPIDSQTATQWYQGHFALCGYAPEGSGYLSNGSTSVQFVSRSNANLSVQVAFQDTAQGSLVLYVAEDVTVPPRPAGSYLPADVVRVRVTYWLPIPQQRSAVPPSQRRGVAQGRLRRTITNPATIHRLVAAVNSLSQIVPGFHTCPLDNGQSATMIFVPRHGRTARVYDEPVCVGVVVDHYPTLVDPNRRVWNTITALMQPRREGQSADRALLHVRDEHAAAGQVDADGERHPAPRAACA